MHKHESCTFSVPDSRPPLNTAPSKLCMHCQSATLPFLVVMDLLKVTKVDATCLLCFFMNFFPEKKKTKHNNFSIFLHSKPHSVSCGPCQSFLKHKDTSFSGFSPHTAGIKLLFSNLVNVVPWLNPPNDCHPP